MTSTREQTHAALERFRTLTESLIEGIRSSLDTAQQQQQQMKKKEGGNVPQQPGITLAKDFSPVIGALAECERTIRGLIARARRQEQLQRQADRARDALVRNEERLVRAVFFPAHEVDGRLRRAINKSRFVCGTCGNSGDNAEGSSSDGRAARPCTIDPTSLASYLGSVRFMVPPSMKLFRCEAGGIPCYSMYTGASTDSEYKEYARALKDGGGENNNNSSNDNGWGEDEDDNEDFI